jgi:hypothetical protein
MLRRLLFCCFALGIACGDGDGDDNAGTDTEFATGSATTPVTHGSASTVTAASMTFTNTSDPTGDPSGDPSVSITDDPTAETTMDPDATASATTTAGPESTGGGATTGAPTSDDGGTTSDTGDPGGPCCSAQNGAGCGDAVVEACVCATDDFCCATAWDDFCTVQVVILGCAECPGIGGDGDCCAAHGNPGCDDAAVEACVCEMDYVCCLEPWDELCVDAAADCGAMCI